MQSTLPCFNRHSNIHLQVPQEPFFGDSLIWIQGGESEVQTRPAFVRFANPGFYLIHLRINRFQKEINMLTNEEIYTINRPTEMYITTSQKQGRVPVTILELAGIVDGSNYMLLVDEAKKSYLNGMRDLLIDLSKLTFLGSSGLAAIHKTALLFRDQPTANEESGWAAYHAIDRDRGSGVQKHVKLLSPQPRVAEVLDIASFDSLFEIHTDLKAAVASF
jgi:anti-anti-sigma regulatory factor